MKDIKKKIVNFIYYDYEGIEDKLNNYAKKGLFLKSINKYYWEFRKGEPKDLKYIVTYFSDSSFYDFEKSDGQLTYIDYAKEYGYEFVEQWQQMHIFSTESNNVVSFQTDEKEKFENIKKCMKKSYLPSMFLLVAIFLFNSITQGIELIQSFKLLNEYNYINLIAFAMSFIVMFYYASMIITYFIWYFRCKKSLKENGTLASTQNKIIKIMNFLLCNVIFILFTLFIVSLTIDNKLIYFVIVFLQIPIVIFSTNKAISYMKKRKLSRNKIIAITFATAIGSSLIWLFIVMWFISYII